MTTKRWRRFTADFKKRVASRLGGGFNAAAAIDRGKPAARNRIHGLNLTASMRPLLRDARQQMRGCRSVDVALAVSDHRVGRALAKPQGDGRRARRLS